MKKKPNLLYIFADQWRRQAVGFAGEDPVQTPRIDQFAKESMVFNQAVSCTPLCSPHRASLLTGKYAMSHGVYTNCKLGADIMLSPAEVCIGDVLSQAGYSTGYIGKWHLDLPEQNVSENPVSGARKWDAYTPPGPKRHGFQYWYSYGTYDQHLTPHYWEDSPKMIQVNQWSVEHETEKAMEFLDRQAGQEDPFVLFLSWNPPHSPFQFVPDRYKALYQDAELPFRPNVDPIDPLLVHTGETMRGGEQQLQQYMRDYFAAISGIDEQFGRLLDHLDKLDLSDDTIIVLTADHGELLGSHGLMAKHSWHEESIGVPFVVRWPRCIPVGTSQSVLNTVDIMPTLLDLIDEPIPNSVEGQSRARWLLQPKEVVSDWADAAYISAIPGRKELLDLFAEAGMNNLEFGWRGMRSSRYTYVTDRGYYPQQTEVTRLLYDLKEDPYQLHPLVLKSASEHPVAAKLEEELRKLLEKTNDPFTL